MQNHWKPPNSQHNILLSSLTRDFVLQKRSFPNQEPKIQIYQNEIHIKNYFTFTDWEPLSDHNCKKILNELTKKVKLYKINNFDKLSFSFNNCHNISKKSMKCLKKILIENFSGLKSLAINLYGYSDLPVVELLAAILSYFKGLTSLQIHLVGPRKISDEPVKALIKQIHRSQKNLKNLSIDLSARLDIANADSKPPEADIFERLTHVNHNQCCSAGENWLTEKGVLGMNKAITRYLATLTELDLNFSSFEKKKITDEVCQELGRGILERMDCLKRLALNFSDCKELTNEAMTLFNRTSRRRLISLDALTIELASVEIDDLGLKSLEQGICLQFKELKKLVVNLNSNKKITGKRRKEFNKNITLNLNCLQAYTLACYWTCDIKSKHVILMNKEICKNVKNLKELVLMFEMVDHTALPAIFSDIQENSLKLEKLSLMFGIDMYIRPLDLSKFQDVISTTLKDIIELNLDFSCNYDYFSNESIAEFGKSLEPLTKLKRLAWGFDKSEKIGKTGETGQELKLGVLVPKNAALERFNAFFMRCIGVTDEHLNEFGASLCEFQKGLRVMNTRFSLCKLLTENGYKKFCYGVKHDLKRLEDLTLNFYDCEKITGDAKTEMKVLFKEVPQTTLY